MIAIRCFLLLFCVQSFAFGVGYDHPSGDLRPRDKWSHAFYESVNTPERVSGYWINGSDTMFYLGGNAKLNAMIKGINAVPEAKIELVLHPEPGVARSAYGIKVLGPAEWAVTVGRGFGKTRTVNRIQIDVWLGRSVTLDELQLPPSIAVRSGGEIEDFVRRHHSKTKTQGEP